MKHLQRVAHSMVSLNLLRLFLLVTVPTALSGAFLIASASSVYAASWSIKSYGWCGTDVRGFSELTWYAGVPTDNGYTNGKLWKIVNGQYALRQEGSATDTGSQTNATVRLSWPREIGTWDQTGAHSANFFSPAKYTGAGTFKCQ